MILSNYWKSFNIITDFNTTKLKNYGQVNTNGGTLTRTWINAQNGVGNIRLRTDNLAVRLGKGVGNITAQDYALFDDCTANIGNLAFVSAFSSADTDEGFSQLITITGTNNSSSDITLTEVGITKTFTVEVNIEGVTTSAPVMLAKMLLDNPITVRAGGSFRIVVEWKEQ